MKVDMTELLDAWEYTGPEELNVRKILADKDNRPLIQMRVDLGILQMEWRGRPDGRKPHGMDTLLDYYKKKIKDLKKDKGPDVEISLNHEECVHLHAESIQYYYRRICMFELLDYYEAGLDAEHNLEIMDLIRDYAFEDEDRVAFEQYRPFVLMHRTRARSLLCSSGEDWDRAVKHIEEGIEEIEAFYKNFHREGMIKESQELEFLREMVVDIHQQRPKTEEQQLRVELSDAVENEEFERAALLRDMLKKYEQS